MSARAYVQDDWMRGGVRIALVLSSTATHADVVQWGDVTVRSVPTNIADEGGGWLSLEDDAARALYEALARHFGGTAVDTTALRRDYDAERKRVDTFISHLTAGVRP